MTNTEKISKKLRLKILDTIYESGKGHIGGAYSCVDILSVLYFGNILNINKNNYKDLNRNKFILSKGHAAIAQYVVLEKLGLITNDDLNRMNNGGILGEHPDINIPGIEFNTGSLGHGLGVGIGMALTSKLDNIDNRIYVLLGDGECYEGTIWESAILASHLRLNNLVVIVDRNNLCIRGKTEDINELEPFDKKWESFGWDVIKVDGHNHKDLKNVFNTINSNKPTILIAKTIKGKGVSFMENNHKWHHGGIDDETYKKIKEELDA